MSAVVSDSGENFWPGEINKMGSVRPVPTPEIPTFRRLWETAIPKPTYSLLTMEEVMQGPPVHWLIKLLIPDKGLTIIFGASNCGKTFVVIDMAVFLSIAKQYWMGFRCNSVGVVFLALEGSLAGRLRAWSIDNPDVSLHNALLAIYEGPFDLTSEQNIERMAFDIHAQTCEAGWRPGMIVIDTLVRACPGMDENSVQDMSVIIARLKLLGEKTGCAIVVIHHSGKNQDAGMRGSTALLGAADQILQVAVRDGFRELTVFKSRDGSKDTRIEFDLKVVNIGTDDDGDEITSCVVKQLTEGAQRPKAAPLPRGKNQEAVFKILRDLLKKSKPGVENAPEDRPSVALTELIEACKTRLPIEQKRIPERVRSAVQTMATSGVLIFQADRVWLPSIEKSSSDALF